MTELKTNEPKTRKLFFMQEIELVLDRREDFSDDYLTKQAIKYLKEQKSTGWVRSEEGWSIRPVNNTARLIVESF